MKQSTKILILSTFLALLFSITFSNNALCQPPPPPGEGHGQAGNKGASGQQGAPIGDGIFLLIGLAGLYAGKKVYDLRKAEANVQE